MATEAKKPRSTFINSLPLKRVNYKTVYIFLFILIPSFSLKNIQTYQVDVFILIKC